MVRGRTAARIAPLVAGLSGLAWFWFELEPQRRGFEDTDNPATGLAFIAAFPRAWVWSGLALAIFAFALVATVHAMRDRLESAPGPDGGGVAISTVSTVGLFAAGMLLGQAITRLAGGPVGYVQSLDQGWGETAYLVTQFVGAQLFGVGGLALVAVWALGVAWLGARSGIVARPIAFLALVPGFRVAAVLALLGFLPEGLWLLFMVSIPGAFLWFVLLAIWPTPAAGAAPATVPQRLAKGATL